VEFEQSSAELPALRDTLEAVLDARDAPNGVLITVDEVHNASLDQLATLGNAIQHLKRQDRPVSAVVAGLPPTEDNDLSTFLGRCQKPDFDALADDVVRVGLQRTAALEGGRFSGGALDLAVTVSAGYPYMVQLAGYWSWEKSIGGAIETVDVRNALRRCERELSGSLLQLSRPPTGVAKLYLAAMAMDAGPSSTSEIARRLNRSEQYGSTYRKRLIDKGILIDAGTGLVDFAVPGHRARIRVDMALNGSSSGGAGSSDLSIRRSTDARNRPELGR